MVKVCYNRLSEFENRVLRKICGCKRDEITGLWRRLHKEQIYDLYLIEGSNQEIEMGGPCGTHGIYMRGSYRVLVSKY